MLILLCSFRLNEGDVDVISMNSFVDCTVLLGLKTRLTFALNDIYYEFKLIIYICIYIIKNVLIFVISLKMFNNQL